VEAETRRLQSDFPDRWTTLAAICFEGSVQKTETMEQTDTRMARMGNLHVRHVFRVFVFFQMGMNMRFNVKLFGWIPTAVLTPCY
jgi:hypothetical protein